MLGARRQMSAQAERVDSARGEAGRGAASDEAASPRPGTGNTGSALLEAALRRANLKQAWKRVRANKGVAGVDGLDIDQTAHHLVVAWPVIREQLLEGTYRPSPVRRVRIPKPTGGERELGIPTVTDRLIQQALLQVLQPILDPTFSEHSYGFRPGRRAHDAILAAQGYIQSGRRIVVDVDLEKFFDRVNHDILIDRLRRRIDDAGMIRLVRAYLTSGIMGEGVVVERHQVTPQGGPLSPLLANVLLDEVDKVLERHGHCFARYADDCNVYVCSRKAGERVMGLLRKCCDRLHLAVNEAKSAVADVRERKFLGFSFWYAQGVVKRGVAASSLDAFKHRIRQLTRRSAGAVWMRSSSGCALTCWVGMPTTDWRRRQASGARWTNGYAIGCRRSNSSAGGVAPRSTGPVASWVPALGWPSKRLLGRDTGGAVARKRSTPS